MKKKLLLLLAMVMLLSTFLTSLTMADDPETMNYPGTPTKQYDAPGGNAGDWYVGRVKYGADPNLPVIIFVHGSGESAKYWWDKTYYHGRNDMYDHAHILGYRTAFVNLKDSDAGFWSRPNCSNFVNGEILARQIRQIAQHFGVSKVNIVAHSKGGVDTNTAIAIHGANQYVNNVVTLASPHWGSHLADVATHWSVRPIMLALKLYTGSTDSLKTSYLRYFRSQVDRLASDRSVSYFTTAGTNIGPWNSGLAAAGRILWTISGGQQNDGLVPLGSTGKTYARHLFTRSLDHDAMRLGRNVIHLIQSIISSSTRTYGVDLQENDEIPVFAPTVANNIFRGEAFKGTAEAVIPVDSSVKKVVFNVAVSSKDVKMTLIKPDGEVYKEDDYVKFELEEDTMYFPGAFIKTYEIEKPMSGKWVVVLESEEEAAYSVITNLDSDNSFSIPMEKIVYKEGEAITFTSDLSPAMTTTAKIDDAAAIIVKYTNKLDEAINAEQNKVKLIGESSLLMSQSSVVLEPGMYDVDITIKGTNLDGTEFERTAVYSIVVEPKDCDPFEFLKGLTGGEEK